MQTARLGEVGSVYGIARQDYSKTNNENAVIFEPLLSWTMYDWLALEINNDAEKIQGEQFNYEATVAGLRLRLSSQNKKLVLGVAARYSIAADKAGDDVLKLSGLGSYQINNWLFGANINYDKPNNSRRELSYAIGVKREIRHHLGIGVEVEGELENEKNGEIIAGIFNEFTHRFQFNVGVGTGFNNDVNLTVKTALIWQFK